MDCIAYNLIDSGRGTVCNCVPSSEPIRIQWIVPNPWSQKRPLWDTKKRQSCDYGKEICKGRSGEGGWQQWEESEGGWGKSNQNALYTCMELPKNKMY